MDSESLIHEVDNCVRLLDDPDEGVRRAVLEHLWSLTSIVTPQLQKILLEEREGMVVQGILEVIRRFQKQALDDVMKMINDHLYSDDDLDLERALLLLNEFGHPGEDLNFVHSYLDAIALRVHKSFISMPSASDLTQLLALNHIMYQEEGFIGATENYYDPGNSYISSIIRKRKGLPVTLSCIELLIAERSGLTLKGIALPYHFVLYSPELDAYIDTFQGGVLLSRNDCMNFVTRSGLTFVDSMLEPVRHVDIVLRILGNLVVAHIKAGQTWETEALQAALANLTLND